MLAIAVLLIFAAHISSSPLPSSNLKYDQRQEGEWNVRADLENFVVLIIPTSSSAGVGSLGLLDLFRKVPRKKIVKHVKKSHADDSSIETRHFIESKSAPYHVDLSRSKANLAKLHPELVNEEELLVARSPSISLLKNEEIPVLQPHKHGRSSKAYILSIPISKASIVESNKKSDDEKFKASEELHLLGDGIEECGPGSRRDHKGICTLIKD